MSETTSPSESAPVAPINNRAFVRRRSKGDAIVRLGDKPLDPSFRVAVTDISQSGIRFTVAKEFVLLQRIVIEIQLSASNSQLQRRAAEVRWVEADNNPGQFRVGCAWIERLSYAELPRLA